ncbi:MAG: type II toxin-antitoxin system VapC family toxin [Aestuariivirga sp.]|jgi:ribonuclease VapC
MVLDTSAIVAILRDEPDARLLFESIIGSDLRLMASPTFLETSIVVGANKNSEGIAKLDDLISRLDIKIIEFGLEHALVARRAFQTYGKGQGHPAQLNFGDCISYATSKVEAMPLLFKGDDFRLTDVECAI